MHPAGWGNKRKKDIIPVMPLSKEEVHHIATLARLELTPGEMEHYREQLSAILDHVARLQQLDTTSVPPMSAVFSGDSHLRADESRPSLPPEKILANAPHHSDGQFKIPPVFEK
jgi:aspartyl-tRNA(Asn)/glutamyl-tRNA(Gln) amidotransferase subunit C